MKIDECEREVVSDKAGDIVADELEVVEPDDDCEVVAERVLGESCASDMLEDTDSSNSNRVK